MPDELVALKVNIIVGWQTPTVTAAKEATSDIPIVMARRRRSGWHRPGGKPVTSGRQRYRDDGSCGAEVGGKTLELVREVLPAIRTVALLVNVADPFHKPFLENMVASGWALGL